jgi:hypothetical protein
LLSQLFTSEFVEERTVLPDHFNDRLAVVRNRFALSLESKIGDTHAELSSFAADGADAIDAVVNAYRRIHGICGVGGAVGFAATSRAAKDVEDVLIGAYRGRRGLAPPELAHLERALCVLADTAQAELRSASAPSISKSGE